MASTGKTSSVAIVISAALAVVALLVWIFTTAALGDLGGSDAAGNAMAQGFTAIFLIFLWILLAILTIIAAISGKAPKVALVAALILVPASGVAAFGALELLLHPDDAPYRWPLIVPALVPPLIVVFCFWALLPKLRAVPGVAAVVWSLIALLCLALWPLGQIREAVIDKRAEVRAKFSRDFAKVVDGAPLWQWTPFLDTPDQTRVSATLAKITALDRRQRDAETMLDRGDFPLGFLGRFDLMPTASLCNKARALLRKQVAPLVLARPNSKRYREIAIAVADAVAAMSWLVGYDCSCDAEAKAWEDMAKGYADTNFDVVRLRELRDPKELGRILRERPAHFAMLTDRAHLKAWLRFTEDAALRDKALAGARKLEHRTVDAVEMLRDKSELSAPAIALRFLPVLDLEPTPALCGAALFEIHKEMAQVYRPTPDNPQPYRQLLARLGNDASQLPALRWLASRGCDANDVLNEAEALIGAYQDSPQRTAMLASLAALHRK